MFTSLRRTLSNLYTLVITNPVLYAALIDDIFFILALIMVASYNLPLALVTLGLWISAGMALYFKFRK
jgi:hypothetical protein